MGPIMHNVLCFGRLDPSDFAVYIFDVAHLISMDYVPHPVFVPVPELAHIRNPILHKFLAFTVCDPIDSRPRVSAPASELLLLIFFVNLFFGAYSLRPLLCQDLSVLIGLFSP